MKVKVRYKNNSQVDFVQELRKNVNRYFEESGISTYGNFNMFFKTLFMLSVYLVPYFLMITGVVTKPVLIVVLWIVMGFGSAGVGLSIMHDANHKSYSNKKWVNKVLSYTLSLLGGFPKTWQYQHNTLHHSFTNIDGLDDDITTINILRFSPNTPLRKIHKYQYIYAWFFYGLMTIYWTIDKDFRQLFRYKKEYSDFSGKSTVASILTELIVTKILYYAYILAVPFLFLQIPWWLIIVGYLSLHFTCGVVLGIIFQTAHVMPSSEYPMPDEEGEMNNNWAVHQLITTTNYSPKGRVFSWLIGGLNYQVEHHLFPKICHIHYRSISNIVKNTANKYQLPYNVKGSFIEALGYHAKMLKALGRQ